MSVLPRILPLAYRPDLGLDFLSDASHEDLRELADILMFHQGASRYAEQLSKEPEFVANIGDLSRCWHLIAAEFQRFGADSIASLLRGGKGALYRDILGEVAKKQGVAHGRKESYGRIEQRLVKVLLKQSLEKMTEGDRRNLIKGLIDPVALKSFNFAKASPSALLTLLQTTVQTQGFAAYQVNVIIANNIAKVVMRRGLSFATNAGLNRALGIVAGPVGWIASAALTIPMLTGPAYRVVTPAILCIAGIRQKMNAAKKE